MKRKRIGNQIQNPSPTEVSFGFPLLPIRRSIRSHLTSKWKCEGSPATHLVLIHNVIFHLLLQKRFPNIHRLREKVVFARDTRGYIQAFKLPGASLRLSANFSGKILNVNFHEIRWKWKFTVQCQCGDVRNSLNNLFQILLPVWYKNRSPQTLFHWLPRKNLFLFEEIEVGSSICSVQIFMDMKKIESFSKHFQVERESFQVFEWFIV